VTSTTFQDAVRLQTSALSTAEKRLLIRIARRLPARISSDHLTALGALAMLMAGVCYWLSARHPIGLVLAVVCLAINWFGDSLDGTVARVRDCQRPRYGFYVDHVLDTAGTLFLLAGLGASGYMSPMVALALLAAYYLISIEIYLATCVLHTFRMAFFKLGPTELRILLAVGTLALFFHPSVTIAGRSFLLFDVGGVVAAAGLAVIFGLSAARNTRTLYKAEPLR
jgi:archaetidylinositol phosphate synthase